MSDGTDEGRHGEGSANEAQTQPGAGAPEAAEVKFCPIAGFGASAGGLEAFTEVLQHMPENAGLAIVFVQHLDPKHASVLTDLLSRATRMPVVQVADGMRTEQDRVYVIPPNSCITVSAGVFHVEVRQVGTPHMPIDHFYRSLAEEQGCKAIGVVLSGTASDGTLGLKAIKAAGGIAIAQSPESAKYDGMPRSAIGAGCVDFVLPPAEIASEIMRLSRHPYVKREPPPDELLQQEAEFTQIFSILRASKGVDFTHYKPGTVRRRTLRRMALLKFENLREYVRHLSQKPDEVDQLFQDVLINVTGFFREPATFDAITAHVLPALLRDRAGDDTVRIWVPGCATGEEAYSVAICLLEYTREARLDVPIQIFGTDISDAALETARTGIYSESIAADVSDERLRRFFIRTNGSYQIARFVRDACIFARQNVTKDPPFSKLDLITCRNLLIYFGAVLQAKVMRLFHYALKPNGFLVLGASETIGGANDLFSAISKQHKVYARKPTAAVVMADFSFYDEVEAREVDRRMPGGIPGIDNQRRIDQMILARYSPPAVVVDKDLLINQFRGDTTAYVGHPPGDATLNLAKLVRGGLGTEIRKLVHEASSKSALVRSKRLTVSLDGAVREVQISVSPVPGATSAAQFLIVFEDMGISAAHAGAEMPPPSIAPEGPEEDRFRDLELELAGTRQYLQSVIEEQEAATEELKSAHEELQSSNEELQSTNEELLTAKEELQSTNEELTTVNEEMQTRNTELQQMNNDLVNLLSSVNIPIVMLGDDLDIRRFTPQAEKILTLIPADVGRSISDFRLKINIPDIVPLCREVLNTLAPREREVQDQEGRTYSMWLRPYRTTDNRIDGLVLALFDITDRKQVVEARYRRLFEASKDGIVIAEGANGEIIDSNPSITRMFGYPRIRLVGSKFWESDLFRGSEVDRSLFAELRDREAVQKTLVLPAEGREPVPVDMLVSLYSEGERKVIQFNIRDITVRRHMEDTLRRNEEQLRHAQKMEAVGRLAGGVAHDFNNLLTAVLGYSDLLKAEVPSGSPAGELVTQISKGAERAAGLTKQLLAFGRKQIVSPTVLDANEVISEIKQIASVMLTEKIELVLDIQKDPAWVRADRNQLEQVMLNLVLNARDATTGRGTITVKTGAAHIDEAYSQVHPAVPAGEYVAITVRDTGTGMDQETQSHLFEPFFTTKPKGAGVGLGLATTYSIVRQSGGYIWAYSELGVGTTFTVYLPRVDGPETVPETEQEAPEESHGSETILLAEDEEAVRSLARRFLEARGYTVLEASNGADALDLAREYRGPIHLLLTDVVMPKMSGRELALQLAPERPDVKVLYMSGHTEDAIIHHGVLEEQMAFLQKPFTQATLARRVRALLDDGRPA